jgi:hypothetical protein
MGERRRYRRLKMRLPLSFAIQEPRTKGTPRPERPREAQRIRGETYDISTEGLTIDVMLSPPEIEYLLPLMARTQKGPRIDVSVELEGQAVSLAGTVIWYNLFFPGTPPPNFKAGLYLIEPDSNPSKQRWNDFLENIRV